MQVLIYSNNSQECERASSLLEAIHLDEVVLYRLNEHFSESQFKSEFGEDAEYPQISIGLDHRGSLKETLRYMNKKGMLL